MYCDNIPTLSDLVLIGFCSSPLLLSGDCTALPAPEAATLLVDVLISSSSLLLSHGEIIKTHDILNNLDHALFLCFFLFSSSCADPPADFPIVNKVYSTMLLSGPCARKFPYGC